MIRIRSLGDIVLRDGGVWKLLNTIDGVQRARSLLNHLANANKPISTEDIEQIDKWVQALRARCEYVEMGPVIARIDAQYRHLTKLGMCGPVTAQKLRDELKVILELIDNHAGESRLVHLRRDKSDVWLRWRHDWKSHKEFGEACEAEIEDAVECYVVEKPTASVFHSMRVAEIGLRALAKHLRVKLKHDIEIEDWGPILVEVDRRIKELQSPPRGKTKRSIAALKQYSDIYAQLKPLKETRNEVSHNRKRYTAGEAMGVMERVRALMELVAAAVPPKQRGKV